MTRRTIAGPIVALVVTAVLAGCGGGSSVNVGGDGGSTSGGSSSSGGGGGTFVAAISAQPNGLDPQKTTAYSSFEVLNNIYDTLVVPNAKTLAMEPQLATSWKQSANHLTWIFHLRHGVKFDDGSSFDAADVVYSFDRIIDNKLSNAYRFATVKHIKALNRYTVEFQLSKPTPNLLADVGAYKGLAILPKGAAQKMNLNTHTDGTGPFELQSQGPGSITLIANPHYWGKTPSVSKIVYRFISDPTTALTALRTGEVDWTDNVPAQDIDSLKSDNSVTVGIAPSVDYWYMTMNYAHKPFGNPKVREAISYAINRRAIMQAATFGAATVNETAIPKGSYWYLHYAPYTQNIAKARSLLAQAGVSHLTMGMMVTNEYPQSVQAAQVVAAELAKVGITVRIQTLDFATWLDNESKGDYDSFILSWLGNIDPADYYQAQQECNGADNFQHYCSHKVDRLLNAAATELNKSKRHQLYDQAVRQIVNDNSYIYLYNPDVVEAWSHNVSGYQIRADRAIDFSAVRLSK